MTRVAAIVLTTAVAWTAVGCDPDPPPPTSSPASQPGPASEPASAPAARPVVPKPPETLLDVVRANDERFPTTQPLAENLELAAAARLRLTEPVFLCGRGDLWITRPDAPPTDEVLQAAPKQQTHVTRERVQFVYWRPVSQPWSPELIAREDDADVWITPNARLPLDQAHQRNWARAGAWNTDKVQAIIVPTETGLSVMRLRAGQNDDHATVEEQHVSLAEKPTPGLTIGYALDTRGLLAWSFDPAGRSAVARFVDDRWTPLTPDPAWPDKIVQVVPFLDGTVLVVAQEGQSIRLKSVAIETLPVDEDRVLGLVRLLADRDRETREKAQADLVRIGPGAWATLRRVSAAQPAEARTRIRAVLSDETTPTLNGITPEPGVGRVVCRLRDGGVVLHFVGGASAVNSGGVVQTFAPAWLAVRPGEPARRLPEALTADLNPMDASLVHWGDEWILEHDVNGPLRWLGNHTEPLLRKTEVGDFKRFVGIDAAGRWAFKTIDENGPTLVIDPTLPDPRPKLPVWTIDVGNGAAGWEADDWPVIRRGGAWVLKDGAWSAMTPQAADEKMKTSLPAAAAAPMKALLTDDAGNVYTDGLQTLTVTRTDGSQIVWPLPHEAAGDGAIGGEAVLIEAEGKLFLANQPGRLIRLTPRLDDPATPFAIDATFARNIPATDIRRIWKDPAGRIVIASGGSALSICFPGGRINSRMANIIPANALRDALSDETRDTALTDPAGK